MFYSMKYSSPVGPLVVVCDGDHIAGLWMEGQKYFEASLPEPPVENVDIPVLRAAESWLNRYFAGEKPSASELPLAPAGSEFRRQVWRILCEIPYGGLTTYGEIARKMAARMHKDTMSAQAVGGAVGHNPISIIIPCHRVIGTNGSLTGYAGGIEKKRTLLEWEGADLSGLWTPARGSAL